MRLVLTDQISRRHLIYIRNKRATKLSTIDDNNRVNQKKTTLEGKLEI